MLAVVARLFILSHCTTQIVVHGLNLGLNYRSILPLASRRGLSPLCGAASKDEVPIKHLFVFGAGYTGLRLCRLAKDKLGSSVRISASVRGGVDGAQRAAALTRTPWVDDAHAFDLDYEYSGLTAEGCAALQEATHVVATLPPIADFDRDPLLAFHRDLLEESPGLAWCGYLSTTGVYGDHGGDWVTESSELRSRRLASRIEAEKDWLSLVSCKRPVGHVFRLAGIYGPGRSALDTVRRGAVSQSNPDDGVAMSKSTEGETSPPRAAPESTTIQWVSRVHVDDICWALLASATRPNYNPREGSVAIYNVADDAPAPRKEVLNTAAELLGKQRGASSGPLQYQDPGRPSGRLRAGSRENKRVSAADLKDELGWEPLYKDHETGLCAILDEEEHAVSPK